MQILRNTLRAEIPWESVAVDAEVRLHFRGLSCIAIVMALLAIFISTNGSFTPNSTPRQARALIASMLRLEPSERCGFEGAHKVKAASFFEGVR